jgi:hypothetical protein
MPMALFLLPEYVPEISRFTRMELTIKTAVFLLYGTGSNGGQG